VPVISCRTDQAELRPGDAFVIETPCGGGYGMPA
jgi:N-methylhydantoinase B/oxoprolinase/acetone carboxylase alpha subunit